MFSCEKRKGGFENREKSDLLKYLFFNRSELPCFAVCGITTKTRRNEKTGNSEKEMKTNQLGMCCEVPTSNQYNACGMRAVNIKKNEYQWRNVVKKTGNKHHMNPN